MRRHAIFHSYCHYYGRYYYHMTTIVTPAVATVAMEYCMTTHVIFSPSTDARCQAPIFLKNRIYFAHRAVCVFQILRKFSRIFTQIKKKKFNKLSHGWCTGPQ